MNPRKRKRPPWQDIPSKANRVLNIVLVGMVLIALRVWHLTVIQHQDRLEKSQRPQKRVVIEPAKRGTIRDRFNLPLAINKIQYNAAIVYAEIRDIPSVKWVDQNGKKIRRWLRKEYITELAQLLGSELSLSPDRIEDLIHSKAALSNHLPFIIKKDITESEYYRLRMLQNDWCGIHTQCVPKRDYPKGKVGGDIIGYMGAISSKEYEEIVQQIKRLEICLSESHQGDDFVFPPGIRDQKECEKRLEDLLDKAYSMHDHVGKTGIEAQFEKQLRGHYGKKTYATDARGNFLRLAPGEKKPFSGKRVLLSISAELQEFAEQLLIQNEHIRTPKATTLDHSNTNVQLTKQPWIKGGAIVAMDPHSGDVIAMASYPRFDPNDFISSGNVDIAEKKIANIHRWFETEQYLSEVWDQKRALEREMYGLQEGKIIEQRVWLGWDEFLDFLLPEDSTVREAIDQMTVYDALVLQQQAQRLIDLIGYAPLYSIFNLMYHASPHMLHGSPLPAVQQEDLEEFFLINSEAVLQAKAIFDPFLSNVPSNYDKVLLIDLCRLVIDPSRVAQNMLAVFSDMKLSTYRDASASWATVDEIAKKMTKQLYRDLSFKQWREENQKAFLKGKREEEKVQGRKYPKPYLDLLDKQEAEMFSIFWDASHQHILLSFLTGSKPTDEKELQPYYAHFSVFNHELMQGAHTSLTWVKAYHRLRKALMTLSQKQKVAMIKSFRKFCDLKRPLLGKYRHVRKEAQVQLEKHLAMAFYPLYGCGHGRSHAYRQATTQGSIFKIVTAYEALVQQYNTIQKEGKTLLELNPLVITDDPHKKGKTTFVGYDQNGVSIPQFYKGGRIPRSHRSGIGEVDFLRAFEVSSNPYFSLLAVDHLKNPIDLALAAKKFSYGAKTGIELPWEIAGSVPSDIDCNRSGLFSMAIGQHSLVVTPLQTAVMLSSIANGGKILKPKMINMVVSGRSEGEAALEMQLRETEVKRNIPLPNEVRDMLLEGMYRVCKKSQLAIWGNLSELYADYPEAINDFLKMSDELIGKSSTAESVETIDLDLKKGTYIFGHTWFGGIAYNSMAPDTFLFRDRFGVPELVIVVYLRFGAWGRDAVPLAAQIAQKWREIKQKHAPGK